MEIVLLVAVAVYIGCRRGGMFSDRSGVPVLDSSLLKRAVKVARRLEEGAPPPVRLRLWYGTPTGKDLCEGVETAVNSSHSRRRKSGRAALEVSSMAIAHPRVGKFDNGGCDSAVAADAFRGGWGVDDSGEASDLDDDAYDTLILWGCTDKTVPAGEYGTVEIDGATGSVLVRKRGPRKQNGKTAGEVAGLTLEALFDELVLSSPSSAPAQLLPQSCHLSVVAIDEDPASHVPDTSPERVPDHHDFLSRSLQESFNSTIIPMLRAMSPLMEWTHSLHTAAYGTLSAGAQSQVVGGKSVHVVSRLGLSNFRGGHGNILGPIKRGANPTSANSTPWGCHVQLVAYVPPQKRTPLMVRDYERIGLSFATKDDRLALAVANLVRRNDGSLGDKEYKEAMMKAMPYFGAHLRKISGLSPVRSNGASLMPMEDLYISVKLPPPTGGVDRWELDSVLREIWTQRYTSAVNDLMTGRELMWSQRSMSVPVRIAHAANECASQILHAIDMMKDGDVASASRELGAAASKGRSLLKEKESGELSFFPPEHYLAMFSPLIFPLVMPLIIGMVREWMRYRKLTRGEKVE